MLKASVLPTPRREFIKSIVSAGGALACTSIGQPLAQALPGAWDAARNVKRVLAVFKCHFDVGFIDTQAKVVQRYFAEYFPEAIRIAGESRRPGKHRYVWTTGSWLLYEYLEQASAADRKRMEQAIAAGDICWHALPFSWQTELMEQSQIAGSLALSRSLDKRFGLTTTGAKMTDVPGHTRGLIAPLAAGGVTFLDIGVNSASRPAQLPPLFVWKNTAGRQLVVMYHHDYGGVTQVPDSDLVIAIVVRDDNSGPHTEEEIEAIYAKLAQQFPNAEIIATNLTEIANSIHSYREKLPVVTQEIGDTWIYGVASDPLKVARYREIGRLRQAWISRGEFKLGDATDVALLRHFLLEAEHTWGTDTKTWLDFDHYRPGDLAQVLQTKNYEVVQFSWEEKRQDLFSGIATLPSRLRNEADEALASLAAKEPELVGGMPHRAGEDFETPHFLVRLDPASGAIHRLYNKTTGREWASPENPIALLSYQTLSQQDYAQFFANYIIKDADWVPKDFGKPNIGRFGAVSKTWHPSVRDLRMSRSAGGHSLLAELEIEDAVAIDAGTASFPQRFWLQLFFPNEESTIHLSVYWFQKQSTRFPEALWLTFQPHLSARGNWLLDKCGEQISPFDVVPSGGRHMHAVSTGFRCSEGKDTLRIDTLDAPLLAIGKRSPLNFSRSQPNLEDGIHCNLFNNAWGTNYIQWFGEDMRFRFVLYP